MKILENLQEEDLLGRWADAILVWWWLSCHLVDIQIQESDGSELKRDKTNENSTTNRLLAVRLLKADGCLLKQYQGYPADELYKDGDVFYMYHVLNPTFNIFLILFSL